jgi:FtsP/CotA-like multicopper oxidase with cupredoxin domain
MAEAFGPALESRLRAAEPLAVRPPARRHRIALTGSMAPYAWTIDGKPWGQHQPMAIRRGERVELEMVNRSDMAHPMHLHGHHFQVVAVNGRAIAGAVRDTVQVPRNGSVRIAFDAGTPGRWLLHCHNLLHMATGMMTEFRIEG